MDSIFSKSTFYDLVTLFLPGALLAYTLFDQFSCLQFFLKSSTLIDILALIGLLLFIGLVIKWLSDKIWCCFRKCLGTLKKNYKKYTDSDVCLEEYKDKDMNFSEYYRRYYYVAKVRYCEHISILESHVAFLQTWSVASIISVLIVLIKNACTPNCCDVCIKLLCMVIFALLSVPLAYYKQDKIYNLVFENYDYLKNFTKNDKTNN